MRRALAAVVVLLAVLGFVTPASAVAGPSSTLTLGSVTLRPCALGTPRPAWCGSISVPLDYTDAAAGTIRVGFGWVPAASPAGTVVAQEGGPGYPSTGTAPDFAAMLGPSRNLLVVDARGTGRSTPIDCEPLQSLPSPSPRFTAAVTACGDALNHTWRRAGGGWVHASDLFTTANSARDLALVLGTLRLGRVDLYGDSYGTYFAQSFLARYPSLLRSVVLDSAYEARDLDPWYRTTVQTARAAFDHVCTDRCPSDASWARIGRLAALLRAHPVSGRVVGTDDAIHSVTVDITALVNIVNDAGYDFDPYRQLDAAARALLDSHDAVPLLRLYAQDVGYDYSDYSARASYYSDGLYMAVACTDYPQLFSMSAPVAQRRVQLQHSIAELPARTFAPFTTAEWIKVLPYTETYTGCLTWPAPTHAPDPPVPAGPFSASGVPVLILNGAIDSLTPAAGGAHIARQLGVTAHAYVAANTVHLVALDSPYSCGPSVVRAFFASPSSPVSSCLALLPPVRTVPSFPATLAAVQPAVGSASLLVRRLAAVAVPAAGDAVHRYNYVDGNADLGLRGGTIRYTSAGAPHLTDVRWTTDTTVTGSLALTTTGALGTVVVTGGGTSARFTVSWGRASTATIAYGQATLQTPAP